ncbi:hypothetical protein JYQ62_19010 [Nostoc sp. UHCC 0702]|nr:hypothetical protein JYQ62_19010 [Nostoc sp. UHCC 0702]
MIFSAGELKSESTGRGEESPTYFMLVVEETPLRYWGLGTGDWGLGTGD